MRVQRVRQIRQLHFRDAPPHEAFLQNAIHTDSLKIDAGSD